jgi:hypothetical protein
VYSHLEGGEGSVCEALSRELEVVKVECLRELPPPPPPPDQYDEAIMHTLLNMLRACVDKENASYDGSPDHAYHYAYMQTRAAMWKATELSR